MVTFAEKLTLVILALRRMNEKNPEQTDRIMLAIVSVAGSLEPEPETEPEPAGRLAS